MLKKNYSVVFVEKPTEGPRLMRITLLRFFKTFQKYLANAFLAKIFHYCDFYNTAKYRKSRSY